GFGIVRLTDDPVLPQHSDAREVAILLHVIESIPDDELVSDIKSDIIRVHRSQPAFYFAQKNANPNTKGLLRRKFVADRAQGDTAIKNVVEDQDVSTLDIG